MGGYHDGHRMHQRDPAKMQAESRTSTLPTSKPRLKITAAQESPWNTFASAMQPPPAPANSAARPSKDELANLNVPERMDASAQTARSSSGGAKHCAWTHLKTQPKRCMQYSRQSSKKSPMPNTPNAWERTLAKAVTTAVETTRKSLRPTKLRGPDAPALPLRLLSQGHFLTCDTGINPHATTTQGRVVPLPVRTISPYNRWCGWRWVGATSRARAP